MNSNSSEKENHVDGTNSDTLSAMVLGTSVVFPAALNAAIELNLFDIISKGSSPQNGGFLSASEIASELPTQHHHPDLPNRLERVLRLLASHSLLAASTRSGEDGAGSEVRVYGVSPSGQYFVSEGNRDGYLASFTSFLCHRELFRVW